MDIRRIVLWIIFSFAILFLWNNWNRTENQENVLQFNDSPLSNIQSYDSELSIPKEIFPLSSLKNVSNLIENGKSEYNKQKIITFSSDVLRLFFDVNGAQIIRAELLKFPDKKNDGKPTTLLDRSENLSYIVQSGLVSGEIDQKFPTHLTPFQLLSDEFEFPLEKDSLEIVFEAELGGLKVRKIFTLYRGMYDIQVNHILFNENKTEICPSLYLQIERDSSNPPGTSNFYNTFSGVAVYSKENKFQKVSINDIQKNKANYTKNADNGWIAFIQHYFTTAWIPNSESMRRNEILITDKIKNLFAVRTIQNIGFIPPGSCKKVNSKLWIGPQDQKSMAQISKGLELVVDYGFLTIIAKPLFLLMTFLHELIGNWGWTIVFLTVLIKILFFPLASASYRSMERMKKIAPRIQMLKEKHSADKQKFNLAMMDMYRNEKINPLGGCLPMFIQIPVFISLYWVLLASVEMHGAPWILWISDLSARDPFFILPTLMVGTMFLQIKLNPTPPDPIQAKIMMIMPLIFGGMMFVFPAGLVLYWCVNNIISIGQQWFIMHRLHAAGFMK